MGTAGSEWLSSHLDHLYDVYEGFSFQQTTVSVNPEEFGAFEERGDIAEVRVRVRGPRGVVAVPSDEEWVDPGGTVDSTRSLTAVAAEYTERQAGIECTIEDVQEVQLVCLKDRTTDEEIHELSVLFEGEYVDGTLASTAAWLETPPEQSIVF